MEMRYLSSVVKIQSVYRGYLARKDQIKRNRKIALIQGLWRRKIAIKLLKELKVEAKSVGKLQETNYALENKVIKLSQDLQQKCKECKQLMEKITSLESQLASTNERLKKSEVRRQSVFNENASEQSGLKKQVDELISTVSFKDLRIQELEEELLANKSKLTPLQVSTSSAVPSSQSDQVLSLQKEVTSLKEEISRLLGSKYKAETESERRKHEALAVSTNSDKSLVSPRYKQVYSISPTPYDSSSMDAIPEMKRIVRTLTAVEIQDEILEVLIINLRIPLPNTQHAATLTDIVFPSHLLGFVALKQVGSNISGHMVHMMGNTMKQIQDFTAKFEDDYVSSFWLSNVNQLLCIFATAIERDISVIGRCRLPPIQRNAENIAALDKIKNEMGILRTRIYQGWMKELKKRVSNMVVPAIIENQSLPGYICDQSGGLWSSWAKSLSSVSITIDQLVNFLSKLDTTMKWYKIEEALSRQILTELIRYMGVSAFNHLILRKNFCTWKRGVQIQYNVSRLEEFCTNQGIAEGMFNQLTI
jgi:myosin-5